MAEAGLPPDRYPAHGRRGEALAQAVTINLMTGVEPPTALFTSQNLLTIGAIRALHQLGRQHTVALVGLDDIELGDLLDPPVTVMAQDPTEIGTLAAKRVFARLDGDRSPEREFVVPCRLVVRGSGEIRQPTEI